MNNRVSLVYMMLNYLRCCVGGENPSPLPSDIGVVVLRASGRPHIWQWTVKSLDLDEWGGGVNSDGAVIRQE